MRNQPPPRTGHQSRVQAIDDYFDIDRRAVGERILEVFRWNFLILLFILNNFSTASAGSKLLVNLTLAVWAVVNGIVTALLVRGYRPGRHFALATTNADLLLGLALVYFSNGFSSPYFLALFLTIIAGSVRFGTVAGVVFALIISVTYLVVGEAAPLTAYVKDPSLGLVPAGKVFLFLVLAMISGLMAREFVRERRIAVRRAAQAEELHEMAAGMASSLDLDEFVEVLLQRAVRTTAASGATLLLTSGRGFRRSATFPADAETASQPAFEEQALRRAAEGGEPVVTTDGGLMMVPVVNRGRADAVIALHGTPTAFTAEQRFIASALASSAAAPLANALRHRKQVLKTSTLRRYAEKLSSLERAKTDFLNLVSHELKQPLAALHLYAGMLEEAAEAELVEVREKAASSFKTVLSQMGLLIDQLLEFARLEDSTLQLEIESVDLREAVEEAVGAVRPLALASHQIVVQSPPREIVVLADRHRLRIVLTNLIGNAVKYSPEGGLITCRLVLAEGNALVSVSDEGLGISAADVGKLFRRFGRLGNGNGRHISGTGLGLYLSRNLARLHGGDISVESRLGAGSTFTVWLPRDPAQGRIVPPKLARPRSRQKV